MGKLGKLALILSWVGSRPSIAIFLSSYFRRFFGSDTSCALPPPEVVVDACSVVSARGAVAARRRC